MFKKEIKQPIICISILYNSIYYVYLIYGGGMSKFEQLQLHLLDKHLQELRFCDKPNKGWIKAIRTALRMTVRQLSERIGISQQSTTKLEENEAIETITLKSLRKVAAALDCKLVYAIVPNQGSLEDLIKQQAYKKAIELIMPVDHSMRLESQGVDNIEEKILELAEDLAKNVNSSLWDNYEGPIHRGPDALRSRGKA